MPTLITDHDAAVAAAHALAPAVAAGASARDAERSLPFAEIDALAESGLLAITVPAAFGGPGLGAGTLAEVVAIIAAADASVSQIPQSHFVFVDAARRGGGDVLQKVVFDRVLDGARIANAQTERGGKTVVDDSTALRREQDGSLLLSGTKYYSTGALFADLLAVRAVGPEGTKVIAYVPADADGVRVVDDWDGFGQRTTSSGTVVLDDVVVDDRYVLDFAALLDAPGTYGARAQLIHTAIDTGIARGALDAIRDAVAGARPWFEAGIDRAADDPYLIAQAGDLEVEVRAAEALLRAAAARIDEAEAAGETPDTVAEASLATAAAKVAAGRAARRASSELFDFGGTRSAAASANVSRHWRDARTHTLHDPERWKLHHLGRWALSRIAPPGHGSL